MNTHEFVIGDVVVPPLAVGTMYFGTQVPAPTAVKCLDAAFETGARFWDTANNYAFWADGVGDESEATIGDWLATRGQRVREQVTIATKVGARPTRPGAGLDEAMGLSPAAIRGQVEGSLRRLRTDHLDVLYAHVDDTRVPFADTLGALGDLVEAGTVRAVAASNLTAPRLQEAMSTPARHPYAGLQQRFTYLTPDAGTDLGPHVLLNEQVSRLCDEYRLTRLGYSPLLSGAYTRTDRPLPEGYWQRELALDALSEVTAAHNIDAGQAVLAWMAGRDQPVIPVVGVSRPEQVTSAWSGVTADLTTAELTRLDKARNG